MENKIKEIILSLGADVCGIANIGNFAAAPEGFSPSNIYKNCKSVVVFGKSLPKGVVEVDPRFIYGHFNYFSCDVVDSIAMEGAKIIEKQFSAVAIPMPSNSPYEYWEEESLTGKGLISIKHAAVLAGIGQLGKNTLLLNPEYGNMLTIGAILLDIDLKSDEECKKICIENCRKCITKCPVQAIGNGSVNQSLCRENTYGKTERGFEIVKCNNCRSICPMKYGI